jgi:hypothetical protein
MPQPTPLACGSAGVREVQTQSRTLELRGQATASARACLPGQTRPPALPQTRQMVKLPDLIGPSFLHGQSFGPSLLIII